MLKFTNPWKKQTSHLIISWISSFSYLTPNRVPESQAVIAIFCLFWTREVSPYGRWTFWILSIGSIQATCVFFVLQNSWNFCGNWFNVTTGLIHPQKKQRYVTTKAKVLFLKSLRCSPLSSLRSWRSKLAWRTTAMMGFGRQMCRWKNVEIPGLEVHLEESRLAKPFSWMEVCQFV